MGQSTDGIICYGFLYGEETGGHPWNDEKWEGDFLEWWYFGLHGAKYVPTCQPFTAAGEYAPGFDKKSDLSPYFDVRKAHRERVGSPPVEWVNSCSCGCPVWLLAVPGTSVEVSRGYPRSIESLGIDVGGPPPMEDVRRFLVFCESQAIKVAKLEWYLGSYWG